jgi:hypothetical protein
MHLLPPLSVFRCGLAVLSADTQAASIGNIEIIVGSWDYPMTAPESAGEEP